MPHSDEAKKILLELKKTAAAKNKVMPEEFSHKAIGEKIGRKENRVTEALNYKTKPSFELFLALCEVIDPTKKKAILKLFKEKEI